jgi:colanic acid/amylovoran biosynthesis glycosyltransferase
LGKSIKIAIYSGMVPSRTFIERLIRGLADNNLHIYLFGFQRKKQTGIKNVFYFTYTNRLNKLFHLIKYSLLLSIFNLKDKKRLDTIIKTKNRNSNHLKVKYYPVLYQRPDIFHLQWAKSIEDWIWVQEFGIKLIVSLLGTHITISPIGDEQWKNTYLNYFPKVDGFHSVSMSMIEIVEKFGVDARRIEVIKSGLDIEKLPFTAKTVIIKPLRIISIGRSHWVKGYSYAIDAMNLLKKENIDFNYTIIGVEKNEELLYKRSYYKLENNITFKNEMSFSNIIEEIKSADILLLSSVEEGIANVVLEAMALGTLVISTDCGGMKELIKNEENGLLVPTRNPSAIATAIKKVSNMSIEKYSDITELARNSIEKQHNYKKMISEMTKLYETVLKEGI